MVERAFGLRRRAILTGSNNETFPVILRAAAVASVEIEPGWAFMRIDGLLRPHFTPEILALKNVTAHEIGHIVIEDGGHPDQNAGVAPLPGTRREERLMVSGSRAGGGPNSILLLKAEWDAIELWIKDEISKGRIE